MGRPSGAAAGRLGRGFGAGRGWLAPYGVIAAVVLAQSLITAEVVKTSVTVVPVLVLAPVLASRLVDRFHVLASGAAALVAAFLLGLQQGHPFGAEQLVWLGLVVVGTLAALAAQEAHGREVSALTRSASTIVLATNLLSGIEPEEAHALLTRSARSLYLGDVAAVYRLTERSPERMMLVAEDRGPQVAGLPRVAPRAVFPAAYEAEPSFVRAGRREAGMEPGMLRSRGLGALLWMPLADRGEATGAVAVAWRRAPRFLATDLAASGQFASLAARAIHGSERARSLREVLHRVQSLLLGNPPAWARGWSLQARYWSATDLAQIGGDFFDVLEVGDGTLAFILADARGKGLEASSLAAVLKGGFRTLAGEGLLPAAALGRLDQLVAREGGEEDFVTALCGRLFPDGRVVLASAGHPLPLGVPVDLPALGPPLGLGLPAWDGWGRLEPGERMICFTDGLVEARDQEGRFIDEGVLLRAARSGTLSQAVDELVERVREHVQDRPRDDLALLGVEYAPDLEPDRALAGRPDVTAVPSAVP